MSRTRATSSTWYLRTGVRGPLDRWRRQSTAFSQNAWRRPDRRTEKRASSVVEALVWPQGRPYKKTTARRSESIKIPSRPTYYAYAPKAEWRTVPPRLQAEEDAGGCGARG